MNFQGTLGVQGVEEKRNLPLGVSSEATWSIYFVRTVSIVPKYILRVASELTHTPKGRLRFSSTPCAPRGLQDFTGLGHFGPKWSALKKGYPLF